MKIVTVLGARPQFVKAAVVSRELSKYPNISEVIIHTGQHFDVSMSDVFFEEMDIPKPNYFLNINSLTHGAMTGRMLEEIEKILLAEKPELVLVYGDTNSTIAGALAAKKLSIALAHVEAGLRSFNLDMPEEINRILTDRISDFLFCPTNAAVENLYNEGFSNGKMGEIIRTGDVMQDAAIYYAQYSSEKSKVIDRENLEPLKFALCTIHRQENTDDPQKLADIVASLNDLSKDLEVVCPLHPRTKSVVEKMGLEICFRAIEPVGYFDMIELLKNCKFVITDSGGLQKEAFFFRKRCITLREQTEWVELVQHGFNTLAGSGKESFKKALFELENPVDFDVNLYGNGNASAEIVSVISSKFASSPNKP